MKPDRTARPTGDPGQPDSPHMAPEAVAASLNRFEAGERDEATRLAWRPAWAIQSRRGAWSAFLAMLRGRSGNKG